MWISHNHFFDLHGKHQLRFQCKLFWALTLIFRFRINLRQALFVERYCGMRSALHIRKQLKDFVTDCRCWNIVWSDSTSSFIIILSAEHLDVFQVKKCRESAHVADYHFKSSQSPSVMLQKCHYCFYAFNSLEVFYYLSTHKDSEFSVASIKSSRKVVERFYRQLVWAQDDINYLKMWGTEKPAEFWSNSTQFWNNGFQVFI